mmetsp:Transcript_19724/g.61263  ORF Transcript_19724/g.61263 Transcript_19724/m.61263 type:complete len:174 (+) Transcript_19724:430-951(+)
MYRLCRHPEATPEFVRVIRDEASPRDPAVEQVPFAKSTVPNAIDPAKDPGDAVDADAVVDQVAADSGSETETGDDVDQATRFPPGRAEDNAAVQGRMAEAATALVPPGFELKTAAPPSVASAKAGAAVADQQQWHRQRQGVLGATARTQPALAGGSLGGVCCTSRSQLSSVVP